MSKMMNVIERVDSKTKHRSLVAKKYLIRALSRFYSDVEAVLYVLENGGSVNTPFASYSMHPAKIPADRKQGSR